MPFKRGPSENKRLLVASGRQDWREYHPNFNMLIDVNLFIAIVELRGNEKWAGNTAREVIFTCHYHMSLSHIMPIITMPFPTNFNFRFSDISLIKRASNPGCCTIQYPSYAVHLLTSDS